MRTLARKLSRPKILLSVGLLASVIGGAAWFYQYNQTPAKGVVHSAATEHPQRTHTITHFNGVAIAFDYPSDYTSVENKTTALVLPTTELYSLNRFSPNTGSMRIGITVRDLSRGSLLEDSAYRHRLINPNEYQASEVTLPQYPAKKMEKTDGTEITYFIPGEKAYAIIAVTSTNPGTDFAKEVTELVNSFVWR